MSFSSILLHGVGSLVDMPKNLYVYHAEVYMPYAEHRYHLWSAVSMAENIWVA